MIKHNKIWRFLFDVNLILTGAAGTKWFMLGKEYAFLYLISAVLLIIADQFGLHAMKNEN